MRYIRKHLLVLCLFTSFILYGQQQPAAPSPQPAPIGPQTEQNANTILINFNNVSIVEFIRFVSRISNKNFVFDESELQFTVTIVSEQPTTIENIMAALLQELRIHGFELLEQGNNLVVHRSPGVNGISQVTGDNIPETSEKNAIVTRLFRLNTADAEKLAALVRPLVSKSAIVEVYKVTNHLIVTDIAANIEQIAELAKGLDSPNNGLVIGQYVVRTGFIDSLIVLSQQIMRPISQNQPLIFVPHRAANSIFIVSTPFLMERTMAILQYLDQNQGSTRIFDLKDLKFSPEAGAAPTMREGQWEVDPMGNWIFRPLQQPGVPPGSQPPQGYWFIDDQGNWRFQLGVPPPNPMGIRGLGSMPEGAWVVDPEGNWLFKLAPGRTISPERLVRQMRGTADLPLGNIERTQFFIYKLSYRKAQQVQIALGRIGISLRQNPTNNEDLIQAIDSVQWIEASNSLIFTGTTEALDKVAELVKEIDIPLRQVFIEMLILDTTLTDSLRFSVNWASRFGGGDVAGAQAFLSAASPLPLALNTAGIGLRPDARALAQNTGFSQGIIGQNVTFCGMRFNTIGSLVNALHTFRDQNVVMTPKLLVEDNSTAEIFVGINTAFPTQAVVNDQGVILTQNFEFRDVGTLFKVTPLIGADNMVTLTIQEEVSTVITNNTAAGVIGPVPTTSIHRTLTKVHIPDEFFLVISGIVQDDNSLVRSQVPCLGSVPLLGAGFSDRERVDGKRNLLLFIRPKIIDTEEKIDNITKHQQDIFKYKNRVRKTWKYETNEALDFFNLPSPDETCDSCTDEDGYCYYNGCTGSGCCN